MSTTTAIRRPEKKHSWSFGFRTQKREVKPVMQSSLPSTLSKEFFTELIKLECDFQNKSYTIETLNQLTQYYAVEFLEKAVEHYDHNKDDISSYFIFKIQDILATKKSLAMLSQSRQKPGDKESPLDISADKPKLASQGDSMLKLPNNHIAEASSEDEEEAEADRSRRMSRKNSVSQASISQIRNQKQRFVHFYYKMENEIPKEQQNMTVALDDFKSSKQMNDNFVKSDISKQRQRLREKLEQRKHESFASQTLNTVSFQSGVKQSLPFRGLNGLERNGSTLESMLKALDDGDDFEYRKFMSKPESVNGEFTPANLSIYEDNEPKPTSQVINVMAGNSSVLKEMNEDNKGLTKEIEKPAILVKGAVENELEAFSSDSEKKSTEKDTSSEKDDSLGERMDTKAERQE